MRTTQPVQTAPGQPYGVAQQQAEAQKAIPLSNVPQAAPSGMAGVASLIGGGNGPGPGEVPQLHAPSQRPNEPLTAGLATGPGAGPEALGVPPDPLVTAASVLNGLGASADTATKQLRDWVNATVRNAGAA